MTLTIESLTNGKVRVSCCWDKHEGYLVSVTVPTIKGESFQIKKVRVKDEENGIRVMRRNFKAYTEGQYAVL